MSHFVGQLEVSFEEKWGIGYNVRFHIKKCFSFC